MSKHTPEPWEALPNASIMHRHPAYDRELAVFGGYPLIAGMPGPTDVANARRAADSVNACTGLNPAAIADAIGALSWLLDDMSDAGEDKNPETGDVYDSVANARAALAKVKGVADAQA